MKDRHGFAALRSWSFGLLLVCALLMTAAVVRPPFVAPAQSFNREVAASALVAYAALRAINSTISMIKEAELSLPVVGGFGLKPGMALDPVDETVARISDVMFLMMAVTTILSLALGPLAKLGAGLAAAGFLGLSVAALAPAIRVMAPAFRTAATSGLFFGLLLPAAFAGGGWLGVLVTEARLVAAQEMLHHVESIETEAIAPGAGEIGTAEESSWWGFWTDRNLGVGATYGDEDVWSHTTIGAYLARAEEILQSSIEIIAIYVLRLLVFPAVVLGLIAILFRRLVASISGIGSPHC